jgi:TonB family protein
MVEAETPKSESQDPAAMGHKNVAAIAGRLRVSLAAAFDHLLKHGGHLAVALRRLKPTRRRVLSSVFAIALNIGLIAIIAGSLNPSPLHGADELHLVLAPSTRSETVTIPRPPDVELPVLQMPDIVIARDTPDAAPPTLAASLVLAPRPDPAHPNPGFTSGRSGSVILKILVSADGSVADATVEKTSGAQDADRSAIAFVKTQWKFLPALLEDKPIQYWTTVVVRLS